MTTVLVLPSPSVRRARPRSRTSSSPAAAAVEKLVGRGHLYTEGGARWTGDALLFSDIGERIMKFDPTSKKVTVFLELSGPATGLIFDPQGRLIAAGVNAGGKPPRLDHRTRRHRPTLADRFEGKFCPTVPLA